MSQPAKKEATRPVIEMTGLAVGSLEDPATPAVEDVNWSVQPGDYWVIGGLHGSGKTAFLSTAAGLLPPLEGSYLLFGRKMPARDDQFLAERLRVGLVFDGGRLFHELTIEENVALGLRYHRDLAREGLAESVKIILERLELSPQAGRLAGTAPRAWQKRAGLARALVLQPDVLLLDNPMSGLDSRHVQWWLETLDQLSSGGVDGKRPMTLVMATDDFRPWRGRAAQFALLGKGEFRPLGRHPEVGQLTDPLVRELLSEPALAH